MFKFEHYLFFPTSEYAYLFICKVINIQFKKKLNIIKNYKFNKYIIWLKTETIMLSSDGVDDL